MGRIHAIKLENIGHRTAEPSHTDWHAYVCREKEEDSKLQLALQWSGIVTGEMAPDKLAAFFEGYLDAYDNCFRGYSDAAGVAYTWIEWPAYNMQRALGSCVDEAERTLGISEVRNTIGRIKYIHSMESEIKNALDRCLRERDI